MVPQSEWQAPPPWSSGFASAAQPPAQWDAPAGVAADDWQQPPPPSAQPQPPPSWQPPELQGLVASSRPADGGSFARGREAAAQDEQVQAQLPMAQGAVVGGGGGGGGGA